MRVFLFSALLSLCIPVLVLAQSPVAYDIVYVRSPRPGDDTIVPLPEVKDPIQVPAQTDLMLLHPNGTEEVLVPGGNGAVIDPYVSFDGKSVYYAKLHDQTNLNTQRRGNPSRAGADIFKIDLQTRQITQLTTQQWTPNTGLLNWSSDHLRAVPSGTYYLGYGIFNLGPTPLPGGKIMFSSSRNSFLPNKSFTAPNLQLYVMDDDGSNVELVGHLNLGSALHPTVLSDGRVMFSSYEAQGLRDRRIWGLWSIWPDGRSWGPLMSAFSSRVAFHFQTELSNGDIAVVAYYNQNNNGFGHLLAFPSKPPSGQPAFGSAVPGDSSNPPVKYNITRNRRYSFSPKGIYSLTEFTTEDDNAATKDSSGEWVGKVTHPSGAPNNDLLLVWTSGPANNLQRPTNRPAYDAGLYLLQGGVPVSHPDQLKLIKDLPAYNEMQPRAVVSYRQIYGIDKPAEIPWLPNDGTVHPELPAGTPFGLVGTSSLYKRDTTPGQGESSYDGLDGFNWKDAFKSSNWNWQGADAGKYSNSDIHAIRILSMEPSTEVGYGPGVGNVGIRGFSNHAQERLRILGEIPVRKFSGNQPILDPDGNPDTSFLAKIPADTPFTFQTLDKDGLVLNMSQTWHQVRPGEMRADCGGCHAHSQMPTNFADTEAAKSSYPVPDLATQTPLLSKDSNGNPIVKIDPDQAVDVEYYRDIKPILLRSCAGCHSLNGPAQASLVLDDQTVVNGYENTYNRLAADEGANYGIPPIYKARWAANNASRYVRKFQSRRSLLIWKIFGRRLDGWTNQDHPTESTPGDPSTLPSGADPIDADLDYTGTIMPPPNSGYQPLSEDEKIMFARWIDLGAPASSQDPGFRSLVGWFADDLRPTLTMSHPRGDHSGPFSRISIGAFDYYSGLVKSSLSVKADFDINGTPAGSELAPLFSETGDHIWTMFLNPPINSLAKGTLTVSIKDASGNITTVTRTFDTKGGDFTPPSPPAKLRIAIGN